MSSLLENLIGQIGGQNLKQLSSALGSDEQQTQKAVTSALPALLGGLARNAKSQQGAESLRNALEKDHDGGLLDQLGSIFGQQQQQQQVAQTGDGILEHVFGSKRTNIESGIARQSGLDSQKTNKLMSMLAPMVMGALGKEQRQGGLDAGALAGMLEREHESANKKSGGMLAKFLDQDGDGDLDMGDLTKGLMGKLFR